MKDSAMTGHAAALLANLFFGLNMPVAKSLLSGWMTPLGFTLTRVLFAVVIFWAASPFFPREHVSRRDLLILALGGFLGFIASQLLFAMSLQYTTPVNYAMIVALSPVVVMLMAAALLGEKITRRKVLGVALGVSGAGLLILRAQAAGAGANDLWGIFLGLLSVCGYSLYLLITRSVSQRYAPITLLRWLFLFTALMLTPFALGELPAQRIYSAEATNQAYALLAYILICSTAIGYFLVPVALKRLRATTVSVYMNLQPIVASVAAIAVGQDTLTWDKPVAALLVLSGAYVVTQNPTPKTDAVKTAAFSRWKK